MEEVSQLRLENEKLSAKNRSLQSEVEELRRVKENIVEEDVALKPKINEMTVELTHAKEALSGEFVFLLDTLLFFLLFSLFLFFLS